MRFAHISGLLHLIGRFGLVARAAARRFPSSANFVAVLYWVGFCIQTLVGKPSVLASVIIKPKNPMGSFEDDCPCH
jgi:hypothetical protein